VLTARHLFLAFFLTFVVLPAIGCHGCAKTSAPPAVSPTPAAQVSPTTPSPQPARTPPLAPAVLAMPIQVTPPASFIAEQLPLDQPVQCKVTDETRMRLQLEKSLAAAEPASFQPGLDQLDGVIRSLKLRTPK